MNYTNLIKAENARKELNELENEIRKEFIGKRLNVNPIFKELPADGRNFVFNDFYLYISGEKGLERGVIEILFEVDNDDLKNIECIDWIDIDDFIKYVEVMDYE